MSWSSLLSLTPAAARSMAARAERAPAQEHAGIAGEEFDEIVRLHQRRIYRLLYAMLRDAEAADALTQECFLRAYRKRASYRGEASLTTWLSRIALNLARDHVRHCRRRFRLEWKISGGEKDSRRTAETLSASGASPEQDLAAREQVAAVWSAVGQLSPQQRAVFHFRFGEEMELAEIAEAMHLGLGTVKCHLFRAIRAVRRRLKEQTEPCKNT